MDHTQEQQPDDCCECNDDVKLTDEELRAIDVLSKLSPSDRAAVEQLAAAQHEKEAR